jgi:type VII secretion protein EccE
LVLLQATVVAALGALVASPVAAAVVAGVGLLLLVVTAPRRGRSWFDRRAIAREYRRRRFGQPAERAPDPRLATLHWLAPGLEVHNVGPDDSARVGMATDAAGCYGVIAIGADGTMRGDAQPALPLELLSRVLDPTDQAGAVLQVVTQVVAAPTQELEARQPAPTSYSELARLAAGVPAVRTMWLAARLQATSWEEPGLASAYDPEHAPALLGNLMRRISRSLRQAGVAHRVLNADELLDTLLHACDLDAADGAENPPSETWTGWQTKRAAHAAFWIREWPPLGQTTQLLESLSAGHGLSSTVSLVLARNGGDLSLRGLVQVAAAHDGLGAACEAVTGTARAAGARLFRLDGEHGPAVYASAPTGGGAH